MDSWFTTTGQPAGLLGHVRARTAGTGPEQAACVRHTARVMFQGGCSTLTAAMGNLLHTLAHRPGTLPALRERPGLVPAAVDELVRFDGPVQGTTRLAATGVTIGDTAVRRGEKVTVLFAAANRDPHRSRSRTGWCWTARPTGTSRHGWGTHACLGTVMAGVDPQREVQVIMGSATTSLLISEAGLRSKRQTFRRGNRRCGRTRQGRHHGR